MPTSAPDERTKKMILGKKDIKFAGVKEDYAKNGINIDVGDASEGVKPKQEEEHYRDSK